MVKLKKLSYSALIRFLRFLRSEERMFLQQSSNCLGFESLKFLKNSLMLSLKFEVAKGSFKTIRSISVVMSVSSTVSSMSLIKNSDMKRAEPVSKSPRPPLLFPPGASSFYFH